MFQHTAARRRLQSNNSGAGYCYRFNTQPPEGGCLSLNTFKIYAFGFQHTAARRRLVAVAAMSAPALAVSTHSRPKAAEVPYPYRNHRADVSTHSRPKAAAEAKMNQVAEWEFQHTAARRRLKRHHHPVRGFTVSTHSRPKAADLP